MNGLVFFFCPSCGFLSLICCASCLGLFSSAKSSGDGTYPDIYRLCRESWQKHGENYLHHSSWRRMGGISRFPVSFARRRLCQHLQTGENCLWFRWWLTNGENGFSLNEGFSEFSWFFWSSAWTLFLFRSGSHGAPVVKLRTSLGAPEWGCASANRSLHFLVESTPVPLLAFLLLAFARDCSNLHRPRTISLLCSPELSVIGWRSRVFHFQVCDWTIRIAMQISCLPLTICEDMLELMVACFANIKWLRSQTRGN